MLWNIIRDFIVQNITGGNDSNGVNFSGLIGFNPDGTDMYTDDLYTSINFSYSGEPNGVLISLGDWFATTLTIIAMCLIVAFAIWLVRWVFKAVSSAFLLRR